MRSGLGPARRCLWPGGAMSAPAMSGLARALRRAAAPGRVPAPRRGGGGAGARPWGWGLALGLALGVRAAPAGGESESGREEKPPLRRGFGAAVERSRDLVRRIKDEAGIPGILVGVSVDGKEVWSEGLGYADVENRVVCKPETIMRIASISKCLTMMAVAKLWEEGKLDLDAPVQKYVPEFPEKVYEGEKVTITTRLLVSHLSGIRHYEKDITKVKEEKEKANRALKLTKSHQDKEQKEKEGKGMEKTDCVKQKKEHDGETKSRNSKPGRKDKEFEQEEYYLKEKFESVIESLKIFKNDPLFFKPGSQFLYSTYGFTLLSAVVERASGQKFTDYMLKMFRDLDMLSTVLDDNEAMIYNRARHLNEMLYVTSTLVM
ncbi:serine beta-lactamase-like protein LACTB, mitochondrial isoform 5-T5 [Cyanocitta cristata]